MRSRDLQDDKIEAFEPGPLPQMGAEGAPQLEPVRDTLVDPPRLCAAGPCRHYHTMTVQVDAQQPMDIGTSGRVFHSENLHYCYPEVGIETNLGGPPVLECSRWAPVTRLFRGKRRIRRGYERELAAFHRTREEATVDAFKVPEFVDLVCEYRSGTTVVGPERLTFETKWNLLDAIRMAVANTALDPHALDRLDTITINDEPVDNRDATLLELGVVDGDRLTVMFKAKETP